MPAADTAIGRRAQVASPAPRGAPPAPASPSMAMLAPGSAARARSTSANGTSGWKLAAVVPGHLGRGEDARRQGAAGVHDGLPGRSRRPAATVPMTSSGTVSSTRSTSSTQRRRIVQRAGPAATRAPEARATLGIPAGDRHDRPAGPVAWRRRARVPTLPAPTMPTPRSCGRGLARDGQLGAGAACAMAAGWHVPMPRTRGVSSAASIEIARPETGTPVRRRPSLARRGEDRGGPTDADPLPIPTRSRRARTLRVGDRDLIIHRLDRAGLAGPRPGAR